MGLFKRVEARLGQLIVEQELLSEEELEQAVSERKNRGLVATPIAKFLVQHGYLKEKDALQVLARQFNLAVMDLSEVEIQKGLLERVPEEVCRRLSADPALRHR